MNLRFLDGWLAEWRGNALDADVFQRVSSASAGFEEGDGSLQITLEFLALVTTHEGVVLEH